MQVDLKLKVGIASVLVVPVLLYLGSDKRVQQAAAETPAAKIISTLVSRPASVSTADTEVQLLRGSEALAKAKTALHKANHVYDSPEIPRRSSVWDVVEEDLELPMLQLNPQIGHSEVVRLPDPEQLEKTPGDRLTVPLLNGNSVAVTVETSKRMPNGDYSWKGYVDGEGDDFPVVFTIGKNSAFATITSLEGSYTMEAVGGVGWLYKNIVDRGEDSIQTPAEDFAPQFN